MPTDSADPAQQPAEAPPAPPAQPAPPPIDPTQTRMVKEWKHSRPLFSCRFDPTGRFICAGGQDAIVQRWEVANDQKVELAGHASWVRGMAFRRQGDLLCTGDYAGKVIGWRYASDAPQTPAYTLTAHKGWVRAVAISPNDAVLATVGNDNVVRLWSAIDGTPQVELVGHGCHVYNTRFHPGGERLVTADLKGVVKDWDLRSRQQVRQFDASVLFKYDEGFKADIGGIRAMAFSPDGKWLVCGGITEVTNAFAGIGNAIALLYDWETGERKQILRPKENFQGLVWGATFHPAGFLMALGSGGGGTVLWFYKPDQPEPFFTFALPAAPRDIDLHPNGTQAAIAFFDNTLRLYDLTAKPA